MMDRPGKTRGGILRAAALLGSLLVYWAPFHAVTHQLEVRHAWCELHGHRVELTDSDPRSGDQRSRLPTDTLTADGPEKAETGCSTLNHERRPDSLKALAAASIPHPPVDFPGWSAPLLPDRCLECAPKQGPPSES